MASEYYKKSLGSQLLGPKSKLGSAELGKFQQVKSSITDLHIKLGCLYFHINSQAQACPEVKREGSSSTQAQIMLVPSLVPINSSVHSGHVSMNLFSFLSRQKLEMILILVSAK